MKIKFGKYEYETGYGDLTIFTNQGYQYASLQKDGIRFHAVEPNFDLDRNFWHIIDYKRKNWIKFGEIEESATITNFISNDEIKCLEIDEKKTFDEIDFSQEKFKVKL
jgi:hypothetical protein